MALANVIGQLGELGKVLVAGDAGGFAKLIAKRLEDEGQGFIQQLLPDLSPAERINRAIESGGASEFNRMRAEWLNSLKPKPLPYQRFIEKLFSPPSAAAKRRMRTTAWGRSDWATSRRDWLNNKWRHDWRSQPRDVRGRWVPGRLDYIAPHLMYRGKRAGRVLRRRRKAYRATRRMVRKFVVSSFNNGG